MGKRLIKISDVDLRRMVNESVNRILNEAYSGNLYHFTNLEGIYGILGDNCLSRVSIGDDENDVSDYAVCLSRTGNPYIGYCPNTEYGLIFRILLDSEKMLSSIRGMRMSPFGKNNPRTVSINDRYISVSDYEERVYRDIEPLNRYCKSIDVFPVINGNKLSNYQVNIIMNLKKDFPEWLSYFRF